MRGMNLARAGLLALFAASCGRGDSNNVMAHQANALDPAQVDLALGPEIGNTDTDTDANGVEAANEVNAVDPVDSRDAPRETPRVVNREATPADTSETPDSAQEDENGVEE
jgi:L-ascorbate metabolism protein UlaG (beta-lactamase superfamily)